MENIGLKMLLNQHYAGYRICTCNPCSAGLKHKQHSQPRSPLTQCQWASKTPSACPSALAPAGKTPRPASRLWEMTFSLILSIRSLFLAATSTYQDPASCLCTHKMHQHLLQLCPSCSIKWCWCQTSTSINACLGRMEIMLPAGGHI